MTFETCTEGAVRRGNNHPELHLELGFLIVAIAKLNRVLILPLNMRNLYHTITSSLDLPPTIFEVRFHFIKHRFESIEHLIENHSVCCLNSLNLLL